MERACSRAKTRARAVGRGWACPLPRAGPGQLRAGASAGAGGRMHDAAGRRLVVRVQAREWVEEERAGGAPRARAAVDADGIVRGVAEWFVRLEDHRTARGAARALRARGICLLGGAGTAEPPPPSSSYSTFDGSIIPSSYQGLMDR
jgi:hypothetical protein